MAISKGTIKSGGSIVFPRTSIDNIVKSTDSSTTYIAINGKITADYLTSANGTAVGVVYNGDTDHLTITNGGLSINTYTANLSSATTAANLKKVPVVSAVKNYISTYTHSANNIPASAVSDFATSATNAASAYVHSTNVIPTSAVNNFTTAAKNVASTYVNSSSVIPVSAVVDLPSISSTYVPLADNGWTRYVSAGAGVTVTTNSNNFPERDVIIALKDYDTIETATTGATVTIAPGKAYKIYATTSSKTLAISSFNDGLWGRESHIELFVANTGYIHTGSNVVLANALEPDSVNNCTVRFHDGIAIISVEDHVAGYIVSVNASSGSGSLYYGLATATNEYISVDASLNGQTLDLAGVATRASEKHVVGNGYTETIISGGITCTSKTTFSNLSMLNTVVSSGTMTLGDVYIPSGSTVSASGGAIGIEKVSGNEGVINFGGKRVTIKEGTISGITISGAIGSSWNRPPFLMTGTLDGVRITGNGDRNTEIVGLYDGSTFVAGGVLRMNSCYVGGNNYNVNVLGSIYVAFTTLELSGSTITEPIVTRSDSGSASYVVVIGSNFLNSTIRAQANQTGGTVVISSGATVDLTGNTNTTPIDPGGGIMFMPGGATVYPSAGQASAYVLGGMIVPTIGNTNVVNLNGGRVTCMSSDSYASNCIFSGGKAAFTLGNATLRLTLNRCSVINNAVAGTSGGVWLTPGAVVTASSSIISGNSGNMDVFLYGSGSILDATDSVLGYVFCNNANAVVKLAGSNSVKIISGYGTPNGTVTISSGASISLTSSISAKSSGITVLTGGCTVNGKAVAAGTYSTITSAGTAS